MGKAIFVAGALAAVLTGCGSNPPTPVSSVSIGQQLIDLKEARDKGAITEEEYVKARKNIVNNAQ